MQRSLPWPWLLLAALLLLFPAAAGRFLVDLVGGIAIFILLLPLLLAGGGWVGWQLLKRRMNTCSSCGFTSVGIQEVCPACGASHGDFPPGLANEGMKPELDPRDVTINVQAVDISKADSQGPQ